MSFQYPFGTQLSFNDSGWKQVNFNISFPHLKCEYASVDATNFMGTHDAGLAARVSKVRLDKSARSLGRFDDSQQKQHKHSMDETPHEGPATALPLNTGAGARLPFSLTVR